MKKAILLARVSTARQEREGLSLEDIQIPEMRRYAAQAGFEIDREFTFSETASDKMRRKFQEMVTYAKRHPQVEAIIAYRVDRITRNYRDAVVCDDLRRNYAKELHFVYDRLVITKNSSGRDVSDWDTKVYLAKQQINRLRDDAVDSATTLVKMGRITGKAPIGHVNSTLPDGRKTVVPDAAAKGYVTEVFDLYSTGAHSFRTIAAAMKLRGFRSRKGKVIYKEGIETIIKNPFYVGFIMYKGQRFPHHYETFIDRAVFDRCQEIRERRAQLGNYKPKYKQFSLRGLVRCGYCGATLGLDTKKGGRIRYVQCNKTKIPDCPQPRLHEAAVIARIRHDVIAKLGVQGHVMRSALAEVSSTLAREGAIAKERTDYLNREIEQSKRFGVAAYRDWKCGRLDEREYGAIIADETAKRDEFEQELARISGQPVRALVSGVTDFLECLGSLSDLYDRSNDSQKLEWHNLIFSNLSMKQERLLWELEKPFETVLACKRFSDWRPLADFIRTCSVDISFANARMRALVRLIDSKDH